MTFDPVPEGMDARRASATSAPAVAADAPLAARSLSLGGIGAATWRHGATFRAGSPAPARSPASAPACIARIDCYHRSP